MQAVTTSRYMPPWLPEPGYGDFADNRRLSEQQIALIKEWVAHGAPEGKPSQAPPPPTYPSEWQLGPPDLILKVSSPDEIPPQGSDVFLNLVLPVGLKTTRWIRAMEIKPGSPRVVHHANVLIDRTASLRRLHPNDWQKGVLGMDIAIDSGTTFDPDSHLLFWKSDSLALVEPPDMPWRLDPGNDLILNMHLKPTGKTEQVSARIGLYFASAPATKLPMLLELEHDAALDIPAGEARFLVEDKLTLPEAVDVLAVYPHAHYLGKEMQAYATLPDGSRKWIILIKDWDIERQAIYRLAKPLRLPKGATIHMRYSYDNSAANVRNPHSPPVRVHAGNRSEDEMGHLWLQVLPVDPLQNGKDARLPLERAWMQNLLQKDPSDPTALYNLASMDLDDGRASNAEARLQTAQQSRPADPRLLTALGLAFYRQGRSQQAEDTFAKALAADPGYVDAQFDLARVQLDEGGFANAETSFRAYLKINSTDLAAHDGLGSALLAQSKTTEAQHEFQSVLAANPKDFDALYNLASIAADANDAAQAISLLQSALAERKDVDAERLFALVKAKQGEMQEAIAHMRAALALESNHPDDWKLLGEFEQTAGDAANARQAFQKADALRAAELPEKTR